MSLFDFALGYSAGQQREYQGGDGFIFLIMFIPAMTLVISHNLLLAIISLIVVILIKFLLKKDNTSRYTTKKKVSNNDNPDTNKNGLGTLQYPNGDIYIGEFKNSLKHGKGKLVIKRTGEIKEGYFNNDIYIISNDIVKAQTELSNR